LKGGNIRYKITVHVRLSGGATRTLALDRPLPIAQIRKFKPELVVEVDRLLDRHCDREIADILNKRGLRTWEGKPFNLKKIDWVIVGGESGPGARPIDRSWIISIRNQCRTAKVPFFFKQWGGVRKSEAGREIDGRTYDEFPERTVVPIPHEDERAAKLAAVSQWDSLAAA